MKFPNKTAFELRQYLNKLNLEQLVEINHSYGPHFEMLEDKIDTYKQTLHTEEEHREQLINEKKLMI